jgi:hypothetical protein
MKRVVSGAAVRQPASSGAITRRQPFRGRRASSV